MKNILSIFMIAVLSLSLLYQPCEAMSTPQRSSNYQQYQRPVSHNQGKVGCIGKMFNFVKTAVKIVFVLSACLAGFVGFCAGVVVGGTANCENEPLSPHFPPEKMSKECKKNITNFLASSGCSSNFINFFNEFTKSYYEV